MRGVHSAVDDIRRTVFKEVAKLPWRAGPRLLDQIPLKMIQGDVAHHRHDVFLERAIVEERVRLAMGLNMRYAGDATPISEDIQWAEKFQEHYQNPTGEYHSLRLQRLPAQAAAHHGQLPGLHLPPLHERLPQGRHLPGQG